MSINLFVFHFDISGNSFKEEQLKNILLIFWNEFIFQFDILGNYINEEHSLNK